MERLPAHPNSVYTFSEVATLRRNQAGSRSGSPSKQTALRVATVVCLVLLALLAVAQVTHVHASASDADHCTLCVAMHSVVPIVIMLITVVLVRIETPSPRCCLNFRDCPTLAFHPLYSPASHLLLEHLSAFILHCIPISPN